MCKVSAAPIGSSMMSVPLPEGEMQAELLRGQGMDREARRDPRPGKSAGNLSQRDAGAEESHQEG